MKIPDIMKASAIILSIALLCACDADFTGMVAPPSDNVNQRFDQSMDWNARHGYRQISVPSNEYEFHAASDIHTKGSIDNLTTMVTDLRTDPDSYFAILLGDLIHGKGNYPTFMKAFEFNPQTQIQNDTVFVTAGNHDLYFEQWNEYRSYWGTATYRFTVKTPDYSDLFISLDTASGTLGRKQFRWLEETLRQEGGNCRHIIVFTHTDIFRTDNSGFPTSNLPVEETFELTSLMQEHGVDLYLQGHNHYRHDTKYRDVRYISIDTIKDEAEHPYYMVAAISDDIKCTFVPVK